MLGSSPEWERLTVLAPVWVVGAGLVGAVMILLVKAGIDSWRDSPNKRLIKFGLLGLLGLVVLLTYLGIQLPNTE